MPRNGSGVYSADWVNAAPNTTIESAKQNAMVADLVADANAARPITAGGTAGTTAVEGIDNLSTKGTNIASAATTDIGAATGRFVHITGTTSITSFGTKTAGVERELVFDGALTLTHNATSLILPGAANITTAAGDTAIFVSEGSGNWRCVSYQPAASAGVVRTDVIGKQSVWFPASAFTPQTTSGAGTVTRELATNNQMIYALAYDQSTIEYATATWVLPNNYNGGTFTYKVYWTIQGALAGNVVFGLNAMGAGDTIALNSNYGAAVQVTDTAVSTNGGHISPESTALTASNTPAGGDTLILRLFRNASTGTDTLNGDAEVYGLMLFYTTDAATQD